MKIKLNSIKLDLIYDSLSEIQKKILDILKKNKELTRDQICEKLGLKIKNYSQDQINSVYSKRRRLYNYKTYYQRTTVYDNLINLVDLNLVEKFSKKINSSRGAPFTYFRLIKN